MAVVTTTPRKVGVLKAILRNPSSVVTHAPTEANKAHLAASFLEEVKVRYGGSSLGRQELEGVLVEEVEGALWTAAMLDRVRVSEPGRLSRVVVAVDPPVTGTGSADECGIVVVGAVTDGPPQDWRAVVLEDATVQGASPEGWARAALAAMDRHGADRLVAEVNQGGDLVASVIRSLDATVPLRAVHASKGKVVRAEPVAALYEQGRVAHLPGLGRLEDQMRQMAVTGYRGRGSPDRVDALVWALTELIVEPAQKLRGAPRVRTLG